MPFRLVDHGAARRVVEEADGGAGSVADAVGGGASAIELLQDRKRQDDGVVRGEVLQRVRGGHENAGVDDVGLALASAVRLCRPGLLKPDQPPAARDHPPTRRAAAA
jgi:hypothetical protein